MKRKILERKKPNSLLEGETNQEFVEFTALHRPSPVFNSSLLLESPFAFANDFLQIEPIQFNFFAENEFSSAQSIESAIHFHFLSIMSFVLQAESEDGR